MIDGSSNLIDIANTFGLTGNGNEGVGRAEEMIGNALSRNSNLEIESTEVGREAIDARTGLEET
ncbi:MAG: hypothetical protein JXC32_19875 [Anaerolineae bacterium]|nr:hypothetical protein [Anaerolineae bacterium]